ncbi:Hypothetical predicted protein [Cloeon dipterum]|uniref:Uncharacterized protein n=1 Tax=Cloeon dipterum TaxID=197152 RepID=A0A8S1DVQ2_9INSE|nr:Hypothetical predicted protein [Cloeon dipterum]
MMFSDALLNILWIACNILFAPIIALVVLTVLLIFYGLITDGSTKEDVNNERNIRRERKRFWRAMTIENRLLSGKDSNTDSTLSQDGSDSTEEDEDTNRKEDINLPLSCVCLSVAFFVYGVFCFILLLMVIALMSMYI